MQMLDGDLEELEEDGEIDHPLSKDFMFDPWASLSEAALERHFADPVSQIYAALLQARDGKPPGRRVPSRSAASIISTAIRSLIEPPGFMYSSLATRLPGGWILESRTSGVLPIAATTSSKTCIRRQG